MVGRSLSGTLPYFRCLLARQLPIFLFCGFTLALGLGYLSLVRRDLIVRQLPPDFSLPRDFDVASPASKGARRNRARVKHVPSGIVTAFAVT
jgi:hypothetical protein